MATIAKFYLLDATSPNTGTMPSTSPAALDATASSTSPTGDAAGASTARDATDVHGSSNPDVESSITAALLTTGQWWGHRRFVSRPLAAHTFAAADGNWTWSFACSESNLNHNMSPRIWVYAWRPSTGLRVGSGTPVVIVGTEPTSAATEQAQSATGTWATTTTISDGDILVFDIFVTAAQSKASAFTDQFAYDGTTEASATTCASFVTPPSALTLQATGTTYTKAGHGVEHG